MTTISSPGIGSGLDVNSIITQLVAIERQPIDVLKAKSTKIQAQISEYGKLKSAIAAFRDASLKLTSNDTWGMSVGTSSDSAAVGVTVKSGAAVGSYSLQVQTLAKTQSLASKVYRIGRHDTGRRHAAHRTRRLGHRHPESELHAQERRHRGGHHGRGHRHAGPGARQDQRRQRAA